MTRRKPPADLLTVADRLHSAAIHLLRRVREQDQTSGLSPARLSALSVVVFGGPVTLGRLAAAEQVTAPTMTRLVAALEADRLLTRQSDAADRRVVWLTATPKGRRILEDGKRRRVRALATALSALNPRELAVLSDAGDLINRVVAAPGAVQGQRRFAATRAR